MALDLQEQEQIDELKTWWQMYGRWVTIAILVAAIVSLGWNGWRWWRQHQAQEAARIEAELEAALARGELPQARAAGERLRQSRANPTLADLSGLKLGHELWQKGDRAAAREELRRVADEGSEPYQRDLARLREAAVLLDSGSAQEAFERLAAAPVSELAARYEEARGDALAALGRIEEARAAYQRALDQGADPAWRELVELKRDGLGS